MPIIAPATSCTAIFGYPNRATSAYATVDATTEAAGAPASWLLDNCTLTSWRSTDDAETDIWLEFAEARPIGLVALVNHQLASGATVRARFYSQGRALAPSSKPVYDTEDVAAWTPWGGYGVLPWGEWLWGDNPPREIVETRPRHWIHPVMREGGLESRHFVVKTLRWTLSGDCPAGYWEAGMLWASSAWQPSRNIALGHRSGWRDLTPSSEMALGGVQAFNRGRLRTHSINLEGLPGAELHLNLDVLAAAGGTAEPVFVLLEPGVTRTWWHDAGPHRLSIDLPEVRREETLADLRTAQITTLEHR